MSTLGSVTAKKRKRSLILPRSKTLIFISDLELVMQTELLCFQIKIFLRLKDEKLHHLPILKFPWFLLAGYVDLGIIWTHRLLTFLASLSPYGISKNGSNII